MWVGRKVIWKPCSHCVLWTAMSITLLRANKSWYDSFEGPKGTLLSRLPSSSILYDHHKRLVGTSCFSLLLPSYTSVRTYETIECMDKADMYVDQQRCVVGIILLSIHKASYCVAANMTDTVSLPPSFFNRLLYCWQTHFFLRRRIIYRLYQHSRTCQSNNIFLNSTWMNDSPDIFKLRKKLLALH